MTTLTDLCTREERLMQMRSPLEMASRKVLSDAVGPAFFVAVAFLLGLAIGFQAGFREGAETFSRQHDSGEVRQGLSETVRQN